MGNTLNPCSAALLPENVENMKSKAKEASILKCKDPDDNDKFTYVNVITIIGKNIARSGYSVAAASLPKVITIAIDFYVKVIGELTTDDEAGLRKIKSAIDAYDDNLRRQLLSSILQTNEDLKRVDTLSVKKSLLNVLLQQCLTFGGFLVEKRSLFLEAIMFAKIINDVFEELIEISDTDAEKNDWKIVQRQRLPEYSQKIHKMIDLLVEDRLKFIYHDQSYNYDIPVLPGTWRDHFVGKEYGDVIDNMDIYKETLEKYFRETLTDCYNTIPVICPG